jgi:hypothetical protein
MGALLQDGLADYTVGRNITLLWMVTSPKGLGTKKDYAGEGQ